jgi:hypothetical protein
MKLLGVALGILAAIGGFVDIGDIVFKHFCPKRDFWLVETVGALRDKCAPRSVCSGGYRELTPLASRGAPFLAPPKPVDMRRRGHARTRSPRNVDDSTSSR